MNTRNTELTEAFSQEGIQKLNVKQTVTFNLDGVHTTYKITKIKNDRVWGKEIKLYKTDDIIFGDKDA